MSEQCKAVGNAGNCLPVIRAKKPMFPQTATQLKTEDNNYELPEFIFTLKIIPVIRNS
jgi:hypothetical protein